MRQYVVDAFTDKVFGGNPAAVCILENWLPDELMMSITRENNLSETAFAVREGEVWRLRWFTPGGEIDLCGHATLATAYVLMNHVEPGLASVRFATLSGELTVNREGDMYELDFPAYELRPTPVTPEMTAAFGAEPSEAWLGRDLLCVFDSEDTVRGLAPDMDRLSQFDGLLQHATSADMSSTASPAALRPSSACLRTRSAAQVTAISCHTGSRPWAVKGSLLIRPRAAAERSSAAWKTAVYT